MSSYLNTTVTVATSCIVSEIEVISWKF